MQILKLKDGVDVESLRKYGFKTGKEWAAQGERCFLPEVGMSYQYEWFHVFAMDEEEPEKIAYTSDEFSIPRMQLIAMYAVVVPWKVPTTLITTIWNRCLPCYSI